VSADRPTGWQCPNALVVHAGIAAFVVAGPVLVVLGHRRRWRWTNDLATSVK
jgi:hypothetical protein